MPTLSAMFRLFDGYSSSVDKINRKTDEATNKILKASGQTDDFNNKLNATGTSAGIASSGIGKLVGAIISFAAIKKGMDIVDNFTNTSARLSLINDGLQTQAQLQNKIFASANRSKGAYGDMASAIAKMGILAGDQFKNNDQLIAFTELVQKSFKIGGASQSEQSSAMLQLTQAMSSGRLQGDEFRSIMENAPMMANAIAKYTGKSKGELKKMSAEGTITSDIIKNAMFAMGDDINAKFATMPYTFADVWNRIKNSGTQAFVGIMEKINKLINTDGFKHFLDGAIIGFNLMAQAAGWLIDTIINGWDTIGPILGIISGILLIAMITKLWAMLPPLVAQAIAWLSIYWPIFLVIAIIAIAISAIRQFGVSWEQIFGFVGGIVGIFAVFFYNEFIHIWNTVAAFINFFGNVFTNPIASIKALFYDLASSAIGYIETMAKGIEDVINKIPGVKVDITSGLDGLKGKLKNASATIKSEAGLVDYVKSKDYMNYSTGYTSGSNMGKNISNSLGGSIDKLTKLMSGPSSLPAMDTSQFGSSGNPATVQGTGKNGAVDVNMAAEDLQYLRDIAERDYVNKFSTATLAPNVIIQFGDVHEEADANKVAGRIKKILQEEIATAAEGAYN